MKKKTYGSRVLTAVLTLALLLCLAVPGFAADEDAQTRGDVVLTLYEAFGAGAEGSGEAAFTDIPAESALAAAAGWAAELGIAKGYGDGLFGPDDPVTREQAAAMLYRYAQYKGQGFQGVWMFPLDYPDAAEISPWADEAMHWAVMNELLTASTAGLEPKGEVSAAALTEMLEKLDDVMTVTLANDGYVLRIPAEYADLVYADAPENAEDGTLFTVSEKASVDAGKALHPGVDYGSGWLFSIRRLSEDEAYPMLAWDMSGVEIFAGDGEGNCFLFCTPTDVRYERATPEEMAADAEQWTALNAWAAAVPEAFCADNSLIPEIHGNTTVDILLNQTIYTEEAYTLSTTAFGPLEPAEGVDAETFVEQVLSGAAFEYADAEDAPDGEYVVLSFPDSGDRLDFFRAQDGKNLIRHITSTGYETLYRAVYEDGFTKASNILSQWYFALAEAKGLIEPAAFEGIWGDNIAGRAMISVSRIDEDSFSVWIRWGSSAFESANWRMTAELSDDGKTLAYTDAVKTIITFREDNSMTTVTEYENGTGSFSFNTDGELLWQDGVENAADELAFIR